MTVVPGQGLIDALKQVRVLWCPGCEHWQLEYTQEALLDLVVFGPQEQVDPSRANALLEYFLAQHVKLECSRPDKVYALYKQQEGR